MTTSSRKVAPLARPFPLKDVSTARKRKILLAAEKLFAHQAFKSVTMRNIATEADLSLALLTYHFGSKAELLHAVFEHRESYIADRLAALEQARKEKKNPKALEAIVTAFVHRALELRAHPDSEHFMRLVARQVMGGGEEAKEILSQYFDPLARSFIDAIHEVMPKADKGRVAACYIFALGCLLNTTVDDRLEQLSDSAISTRHPEVVEPLLVTFITAGIRSALALPNAKRSSK